MANPFTAPVVGWASRLRFPTLFKLTVALMLISWLWPFDPIPFIDEIATALAVLVLGSWKNGDRPPGEGGGTAGGGDGRVIEGESRRE